MNIDCAFLLVAVPIEKRPKQNIAGSINTRRSHISDIVAQRIGPKANLDCLDIQMSIQMDDAELLLSKLYYELSEQLFSIRSVTWDVKSALHLSSHNSNGEGIETSKSHPLIHLSKKSTELEKLLAGLGLPEDPEHNNWTFPRSQFSTPTYARLSFLLLYRAMYELSLSTT